MTINNYDDDIYYIKNNNNNNKSSSNNGSKRSKITSYESIEGNSSSSLKLTDEEFKKYFDKYQKYKEQRRINAGVYV